MRLASKLLAASFCSLKEFDGSLFTLIDALAWEDAPNVSANAVIDTPMALNKLFPLSTNGTNAPFLNSGTLGIGGAPSDGQI